MIENSEIVKIDFDSSYFKGAELLSNGESSNLVSNGMIEHAAALFLLMLRKCTQNVKIVSDQLKSTLYLNEHILNAIKEALKKGVKIEVIVRGEIDVASREKFETLKDSGNLTIKKMAEPSAFKNDFALFDDRAFRFEEPCAHSAIASFNRKDLVDKLEKKFDELFTVATAINSI